LTNVKGIEHSEVFTGSIAHSATHQYLSYS